MEYFFLFYMKLKAKSVYDTLETIEATLQANKRAFYTRFGDGEIYVLNGQGTMDHSPDPKLTAEMQRVWKIDDPEFLKGVSVNYPKEAGMVDGVLAPFSTNAQLEKLLLEMGEQEGTLYENFIPFHYLCLFDQQRMQEFLNKFVRPKKKMFIGSSDPRVLEYVFGKIDVYIHVPAQNAFQTIDSWYPQVEEHLNEVELVLPAAGATTKVLQRRLWESGAEVHSLDIGSVADVVQQRGTRRWIRLLGHRSRSILMPGWRDSGLFPENRFKEVWREIKYLFHIKMGH